MQVEQLMSRSLEATFKDEQLVGETLREIAQPS